MGHHGLHTQPKQRIQRLQSGPFTAPAFPGERHDDQCHGLQPHIACQAGECGRGAAASCLAPESSHQDQRQSRLQVRQTPRHGCDKKCHFQALSTQPQRASQAARPWARKSTKKNANHTGHYNLPVVFYLIPQPLQPSEERQYNVSHIDTPCSQPRHQGICNQIAKEGDLCASTLRKLLA